MHWNLSAMAWISLWVKPNLSSDCVFVMEYTFRLFSPVKMLSKCLPQEDIDTRRHPVSTANARLWLLFSAWLKRLRIRLTISS